MKRPLFLIVLAALLLPGCLATASKRGMLDSHTWYSQELPDLVVSVHPDLKHQNWYSRSNFHHRFVSDDRIFMIDYQKSSVNVPRIEQVVNLYHHDTYTRVVDEGDFMIAGLKGHFWDFVGCNEKGWCFLNRHIACKSDNGDLFQAVYFTYILDEERKEWKTGRLVSGREREKYEAFIENFNRDVTITRYSDRKPAD